MAGIKKRNGWYYVVYSQYSKGKQVKKLLSLETKNREYAQRKIKALDLIIEEERLDPFDDFFDISYLLDDQKNKEIKPSTIKKAFSLFLLTKRHLRDRTTGAYEANIDYFMDFTNSWDYPLHKINTNLVEKFLFRPKINPNTVRTNARHLSAFFNYLVKKEWIKKNPIHDIELPKPEIDYFSKMITPEEFKRLFKAFDIYHTEQSKEPNYREQKQQRWFKPLMATYYYTGLRLHEAAYSNKLDYSGIKGVNLLNECSMIYFSKGKGKKERFVPISKHLRPYLIEYLKYRGTPGPNEYLFINMKGQYTGRPITGSTARAVFNFYCKKAKVPKSRQIHGFRHRVITDWIERGLHVKDASLMAGHSSFRVTESTYTHLLAKNIEEKFRRLEEGK